MEHSTGTQVAFHNAPPAGQAVGFGEGGAQVVDVSIVAAFDADGSLAFHDSKAAQDAATSRFVAGHLPLLRSLPRTTSECGASNHRSHRPRTMLAGSPLEVFSTVGRFSSARGRSMVPIADTVPRWWPPLKGRRASRSGEAANVPVTMLFWQLTIDANDPALLARFWAKALGYQPVPPAAPDTTWNAHYRSTLGEDPEFDDRLFDPNGIRPPIFFQEVPEARAGKNRLHLDLYPTARDDSLPLERRVEIVDGEVNRLVGLGATIERRFREEDPDPHYHVVMHDPEGNEFCVS